MRWKAAILTASDRGARGEKEDASAQIIRELVEEDMQGEVVDYRVVPDEMDEIMAALIEMADYYHADLIITTGGTGLGTRDVTPEATARVIDREVPGLAEAMRAAGLTSSRQALLWRGISGIRGRTLILNLPDHPKWVHICLAAVLDVLPQALQSITGRSPAAN